MERNASVDWMELSVNKWSTYKASLGTWKISVCPQHASSDVFDETFKVSQRVAEECHEDFMTVHYVLTFAKQVQQSESPMYDNIFVRFGPFHIKLA